MNNILYFLIFKTYGSISGTVSILNPSGSNLSTRSLTHEINVSPTNEFV